MSSMTTDEEVMALNALFSVSFSGKYLSSSYLEEPRKIHPNTTTQNNVRYNPLRGTWSFG